MDIDTRVVVVVYGVSIIICLFLIADIHRRVRKLENKDFDPEA